MILLHKRLTVTPEPVKSNTPQGLQRRLLRQNVQEALDLFGFFKAANDKQKDVILNIIRGNPVAVADAMGALVAKLFDQLKLDQFIPKAISILKEIAIEEGYDEVGLEEIVRFGANDPSDSHEVHPHSVVLAVGCQNTDMVNHRVATAQRLCVDLANAQREVHVTFAGGRPDRGVVKIQHEGKYMFEMFSRLIEGRKGLAVRKLLKLHVRPESLSKSSRENVEELFNFYEKEYGRFPGPTIFLVSSTYHLLRLADEFALVAQERLRLRGTMDRFACDLILVGAEDPDPRPDVVSKTKLYVRLLVFELLSRLLHDDYVRDVVRVLAPASIGTAAAPQ